MENKKKVSFIQILMYILIAALSIYILYSLTNSALLNRNSAYLKHEVTNQYSLYLEEYKKDKASAKTKEEKDRFLKMYTRGQALEIDLTPAYTINTLESGKDLKVILEFYQVRSIKNNKDGKKTRGILVFTDTYNYKSITNEQFSKNSFGSVHDYNGAEGLIIQVFNLNKTLSQVQNLLQPQSPFIIQDMSDIKQISITSASLYPYSGKDNSKTLQNPDKWYQTVPKTVFFGYTGTEEDAEGNNNTIKENISKINDEKTNFVQYENYDSDLKNHNSNVILVVVVGVIVVLILNYFMIAHKYVKPLILKKFGKDKKQKTEEVVSEKEEQTVLDADFKDIDKK